MAEQPTQKQADDAAIASGWQRKPNEFSHPPATRHPLVKIRGVLFVCKEIRLANGKNSFRCGACLRGDLGPWPRPGKKCRACTAKVVERR